MKHIIIKASVVLFAAGILGGCKTAPASLYQWGSYQPQVYQHFKGESPNEQIAALEKDLQRMNSSGKNAPPGFHAHLGMLYSMVGRNDLVAAEFEEEKRLFPESTTYMDRLLETMSKGSN
jgi:hypothetical protein